MPDADDSLEDDFYQEMKTHFGKLNTYISKWLRFNPWKLVDISHEKGGAWAECYKEGENNIIPVDLIKQSDLKQELKLL